VYQRAKKILIRQQNATNLGLNDSNYEGIKHSIFPIVNDEFPGLQLRTRLYSNHTQPFTTYFGNEFWIIKRNAIVASNKGAQQGKFYHNTGEGGLTEFHQQGGAICWQIE
jgi:hypothetical protein